MTPSIHELILADRKIAYVLTDRKLNILEAHGKIDLFCDHTQNCLGQQLPDVCIELMSSIEILSQILNGELPRFELFRVNRGTQPGQTQYLDLMILPYRDEGDQITGLLYFVQDTTETGNLEQHTIQSRNELRLLRDELTHQNQELNAANTELQRLSEVKSSFVSIAAHELRSPMTSIRGYVEMLLEEDVGELNSEQVGFLQMVQQSTSRLLTVTQNLLDASRIETGRIDLLLQPVDLSVLIKHVSAIFRPQLQSKNQTLNIHVAPNLPLALCDETRSVQIIDNLLSNASKYTPQEGSITLSLNQADEAGFLQFTVSDTGIGIAVEEQEKLFERFYRAGNVHEIKSGGTGLGLHITRSLVELHGGRIWVDSKPGNGSAFFVTFPIAEDL